METHLDPTISNDEIEIESFSKNFFRKDRNRHGGGLLIYSKDDVGIIRRKELENHFDETIWVEVRVKGQRFLLCNTYRPEWTDQEYWARLTHAIEMGYQTSENIVIAVDLNSDLLSQNNNRLLDIINLFNFSNVIQQPTRVTEQSSTLFRRGSRILR